MITIIKWELEARSLYKSGLFFQDRKSAEKCKKFLIVFYGHRCPQGTHSVHDTNESMSTII